MRRTVYLIIFLLMANARVSGAETSTDSNPRTTEGVSVEEGANTLERDKRYAWANKVVGGEIRKKNPADIEFLGALDKAFTNSKEIETAVKDYQKKYPGMNDKDAAALIAEAQERANERAKKSKESTASNSSSCKDGQCKKGKGDGEGNGGGGGGAGAGGAGAGAGGGMGMGMAMGGGMGMGGGAPSGGGGGGGGGGTATTAAATTSSNGDTALKISTPKGAVVKGVDNVAIGAVASVSTKKQAPASADSGGNTPAPVTAASNIQTFQPTLASLGQTSTQAAPQIQALPQPLPALNKLNPNDLKPATPAVSQRLQTAVKESLAAGTPRAKVTARNAAQPISMVVEGNPISIAPEESPSGTPREISDAAPTAQGHQNQ